MIYIWFVIALIFLLMELGQPGLFLFLSFFFGALLAGAVAYTNPDLVLQSLAFLGGSVLAFLILSRWVKQENKQLHKTNVYALKGKRGLVIKAIHPQEPGEVKLGGEIWSAKAHETLRVGTLIEVVHVQGVHVVVKSVKES